MISLGYWSNAYISSFFVSEIIKHTLAFQFLYLPLLIFWFNSTIHIHLYKLVSWKLIPSVPNSNTQNLNCDSDLYIYADKWILTCEGNLNLFNSSLNGRKGNLVVNNSVQYPDTISKTILYCTIWYRNFEQFLTRGIIKSEYLQTPPVSQNFFKENAKSVLCKNVSLYSSIHIKTIFKDLKVSEHQKV